VDSPITRQRISGLTGLRTRRIVRRIRSGDMSGFARGTEVELLLDPDLYTGTGVFLFASVLEAFLGLYASLNSFVETVAHTKLREGILKRWPPRAGEQSLL
jgi:type VI secretion system protein ImpG